MSATAVTSSDAPTRRDGRRRARPGLRERVGDLAGRYALLGIFILVIAFFSLLRPDTYFTWLNFSSILSNQAVTLLLALAVLVPLMVGEFDLSVAAIFGFCQLLVIGLMVKSGLPVIPAVLLTIALGCAIGAFNAVLISVFQVSSFIATLGTQTLLAGAALAYAKGQVVQGEVPASFLSAGQGDLLGIPLVACYALGVAAVLWLVLTRTALGRRMLATGGNPDAARLSGVRVGLMVAIAFVICGALAGATGAVVAAQLGTGQPLLGPSYLLPAYAGAFLGATTITPGRFNVWGTVIAVYLLAAGVTGLQQLGVASWVEYVFNGTALLLSVILSGYAARARARAVGAKGLRARQAETEPHDPVTTSTRSQP